MKTEMGEYLVGAYLKMVKGCDIVDYNVRRPGGGLAGLDELDVMGLDFKNKTAYLCEVTTHLEGLLIGKGNESTIKKISEKYKKQQTYAENHLSDFPNRHFMFWSPVVRVGYLTTHLGKIDGLELVINETYASYIDVLQKLAKKITYDTGNPAFRLLQILEHLRRG